MELKELQKQEAIKRMEKLKLAKEVINDFNNNGRVYYSERQNKLFDGILYWLDNEPEWLNKVKEFETKHNALVYHCQLTHFEFGDCLSLLYVSNDQDEWEIDNNDLKDGYAFSYVINLDDEWCSEFGTIGVKPINGGITRFA